MKTVNSNRNGNCLVIAEIVLLLVFIISISVLFYPEHNRPFIDLCLILWGLVVVFGYLFGEFEPTISIYFGLNIRTQLVFLFTFVIYTILLFMLNQLPLFNILIWFTIWIFLNLIAPVIGFALRRIFPVPVLLVTDNKDKKDSLLWWGYKCQEQVTKDEFPSWLKKHSNQVGRISNYELILLDMTNPVSESLINQWSQKYFINFIGIKSYNILDYISGFHTRVLTRFPGRGTSYRLKRFIDFFVCLSVLFLMSPLFLFLVLCIKLDSPGSVFYRHRRLGKNMKPFDLLKLRTMYQDADKRLKMILASDQKLKEEFERTFKLKKDPRITRTGKIIRQLSIDELPQIFNVLNGNMSLVGPRPIVEEEIQYYQSYSLDMFRVLPGVTGLWQTSGRTEITYEQRVKLDTQYVHRWSLLNDLKILIKTIPVVASQRGAY